MTGSGDPYPFTMGEVNIILRLPLVDRMMHRRYDGTDGDVIFIDHSRAVWTFVGQQIDTKRFMLLHERVKKSIADALRSDDSKEVQRLMIRLKMTTLDDIDLHALAVATACELYAVGLQHGNAGVKSYLAFKHAHTEHQNDARATGL